VREAMNHIEREEKRDVSSRLLTAIRLALLATVCGADAC